MVAWDATIYHNFSNLQLLTLIEIFIFLEYELPSENVDRQRCWQGMIQQLIKEVGQREALIQ